MVPKNQIGKILDIVFIIGGFLLFITVGNLSADCLVVIQAVNSLLDTFLNGFFAGLSLLVMLSGVVYLV